MSNKEDSLSPQNLAYISRRNLRRALFWLFLYISTSHILYSLEIYIDIEYRMIRRLG